MREIVLASGSPRRRALLAELGLALSVIVSEIDETPLGGEAPAESAVRLARAKAEAVAARLGSSQPSARLVLAADTVVEIDGLALGKPTSAAAAARMLERLSGRMHAVHTALTLIDLDRDRSRSGLSTSSVRVRALTRAEIAWYVATGEGVDKAGGYAVQGLASLFIERVEGSYSNVVGLPLDLFYTLALELGCDLKELIAPASPGPAR
jgi:septum formation protein